MAHFNAHPVTADMGLRQGINTMLAHVAYNGRDFGYLPQAVHESNFHALAEDYAPILDATGDILTLAPIITDSGALASLTDTLVGLCNDYPAYDDEDVSRIEYARLVEMIEECKGDHGAADVDGHDIARALWEIGAYVEQSEYGAYVSEDDFTAAITYAREHYVSEAA